MAQNCGDVNLGTGNSNHTSVDVILSPLNCDVLNVMKICLINYGTKAFSFVKSLLQPPYKQFIKTHLKALGFVF